MTPKVCYDGDMIGFAEKLDGGLIRMIDGFCSHIQDQLGVPFGWMLSVISIGTAVISLTAAMLMFDGDQLAPRIFFAILWLGCLTLIVMFFRRTLWLHMRKWPRHLMIQHWTRMAMMARSDGRPIRYMALFGTAMLTLSSTLQLIAGYTEFALTSLRFIFVSIVPVIFMTYAFCVTPAPQKS